ncbi:MAG: hypothetical protein QOI81_884 [Actinomycetota bacterium]|nr:hypothetical protein [Actinomycetota bacterium]
MRDDQLPLEVGAVYEVFGMAVVEGKAWYVVEIALPGRDRLTFPFPATLFEVVDPTPGPRWTFGVHKGAKGAHDLVIFSFPPAADDPGFFERLLDGSPEETQLFIEYRQTLTTD